MASNGLVRDGHYQGRQGVPRSVLHTSPVRLYEGRQLPLDLIQRIISQIEDVADIARVTRSSRLFYYMTLPRLYESVTLKSYPELRYIDGQPEGYGGGSPFSMGLNGLVTRNFSGYVKRFNVEGEWRERDVEEFSKGRIPDNSMMLNIAIRAAVDRMTLLESFCWELSAKPMPTVYQGLSSRPTLKSLTIKSPTQRIIRPTCVVPPIPSLQALRLTDIDPLCYPDDFSVLLLYSKQLEELNLHFSPRMREQGEPSISLSSLFGKCSAAGYRMKLKRIGIMNLYAINSGEIEAALNPETMERVSFINNVDPKNPKTVFFDRTWIIPPHDDKKMPKKLKMMRGEGIDPRHAQMVARIDGLEEFYLISKHSTSSLKTTPNGNDDDGQTPATPSNSEPPTPSYSQQESISLASDYLAVLSHHHGATLRILLLSDQWRLGDDAVMCLVRNCPHLEQFGVGVEDNDLGILRKMMSFLPKLYALRLLVSVAPNILEKIDVLPDGLHSLAMSYEFWKDQYKNIRWLGMGHKAFELGGVIRDEGSNPPRLTEGFRRVVKPVPWEKVSHVEIFGLDCMELV